jgi:hypothetical protein
MNGFPPPTGARHAPSHLAVFRATSPPVLDPDRSGRDDPPLCARCRRSGSRRGQASCEQSVGLRRSALRASPSGWRAGPVGIAAGTNGRLRRATDRGRFGAVRRLCAAPPRTRRGAAKVSGTAALRFGGLAHQPSCWHRRGLGHGSRRSFTLPGRRNSRSAKGFSYSRAQTCKRCRWLDRRRT